MESVFWSIGTLLSNLFRKNLNKHRQIIVFQIVIQNIGSAYDAATGIFTSPVNGIFMFSVQVRVHTSKWEEFQLVVDRWDNVIFHSLNAISSSIAYYLTQGQKVWVQSNTNSGSYI